MGPETRGQPENVDSSAIRAGKLSSKDKKLKRKEVNDSDMSPPFSRFHRLRPPSLLLVQELARLKDLKDILQLANEKSNLLDEFQAFSKFNRNGMLDWNGM